MDRDQVLFRLFGKYCPEGTILYAEGSPGEEAFLVQSGGVRLGRPRPGEAPGEALGPGELLGEEAFFGRAPRRRHAETVRDSRLIQVSDRTVDAIVRQSPEAARALLERFMALAGRARRDLEAWTIAHLARRAAPHLRESAGRAIRPADLAEHSGLDEGEAALLLERLARSGGLGSGEGSYRVGDPAALERLLRELTAEDPGA